MRYIWTFFICLLPFGALTAFAAEAPATNNYAAVDAIFSKYCLDCHASQDPDGKLVLESFDTLMKGSESGPVVVPGKGADSVLVRAVEGKIVKNGKTIIMPPGKKRAKLRASEIAILRSWIDAGAHPPLMTNTVIAELNVPKVATVGDPRNPINVLVHVPWTNLIAVGRYRKVELRLPGSGEVVRTLSGPHGNVNSIAFSSDGRFLFAGSGDMARFGEIKEWNVATGKLVRTFVGHKDAVFAVAVSPDGKLLASGSYDQKIKLWNIATGKELKTLSGHNGCVFDLAFRPDGKILASASADHTVKLWDVARGERTDTLSQPLKDVFAIAFDASGSKLLAAGVDNRIRIWQISQSATETTDPLLDAKFAAEGAILRLAFSPDGKWLASSADDRTVRIWDAAAMKEKALLEKQPDWPVGLDFTTDGKSVAVGRLDGSLAFYDLTGKPLAAADMPQPRKSKKMKKAKPPPSDKPEITALWPRGMQRGTELTLNVTGVNLLGLTAINSGNPKLAVTETNQAMATQTNIRLRVKAAADLPRGAYDISLANEKGTGAAVKLYIGHLPHAFESETNKPYTPRAVSLPLSYWGMLNPGGDLDELDFHAQSGQTLVFDLSCRDVGSKAQARLTLLDSAGHILASQGDFDGGDPLLAYTVTNSGAYRIQITENTDQGSPEFYYRLTMGELPEVVSVFPPTVRTNSTAEIHLIGYNLAGKDTVKIKPTKPGEIDIPLDRDTYRARRTFKVLVTEDPVVIESEPNDTPAQANPIPVPCTVCGQISPGKQTQNDVDLFRFDAKAGEQLILVTDAARRGSPVDTKIEVLYPNGAPVERVQLQAVRDSAINFREIDSSATEIRIDNWQEMLLDQYLYMEGEVCRLFRAPRGPDSGFEFYTSSGKRRDYFDTSATDHALDSPCYIVEPHVPGEKLQPNGLPVFPIYYANDDDSDRELGTDSRVHFTAPATGSYLVRVTDNRNRGGPRFFYRLIVRDARPDFNVALNGATPTISPGTGRAFSLSANRSDHFDGDIRVDISGVPAGFRTSTPIVIQAGHSDASGTIFADTNAMAPKAADLAKIKVTATAMIDGKKVVKEVNSFTQISIGGAPTLLVACEPYNASDTNFVLRPAAAKPLEITLAPDHSVPVWIKIQRRGHNDLVTFDGANLPHGVIIDNIGLNGVLIPKDENQRQIFLHCEKWVPDTDRLFYVKAAQAGEPTSLPVMLHIRRPMMATQTASAAK